MTLAGARLVVFIGSASRAQEDMMSEDVRRGFAISRLAVAYPNGAGMDIHGMWLKHEDDAWWYDGPETDPEAHERYLLAMREERMRSGGHDDTAGVPAGKEAAMGEG